ncbi:response regulator [Diplocloster agilis]|uniref:Stage 0 sporulation protein A homolog n=1 Tax=Diplocloster agilis TaxID=2850323 RepID=A0A949K7A4_9FIRM|nr:MULTISPECIES: response regulator [Lachnospiraceae]MBU9736747.1 response regulator [Diplocloster agilis]MCU6736016.1 response regulator [Suonthocola fibrivorans]SCJ85352.1 Uncharacterized response regulatory protein SA0215 [uncultured Clostridium sp.]
MNKKMYKVLIADDEVWVTALVRGSIDWTDMNLELAGEAENGDEAYEMILSLRPDIVITDIRMPGLSGIELMEKVRLTDLKVEFIILSGFDSFTYAQAAMKYNAVSFVLKPLEEEELRQALQKAVERLSSEQIIRQTVSQARSQQEELRREFLLRTVRAGEEENFSLTLEGINQKYDCHFRDGHFFVMIIHMERIPEANLLQQMLDASLRLPETGVYDRYALRDGRRLILLINTPFSPTEDYTRLASGLFQCLDGLCRPAGIQITAALGPVSNSWPLLHQSYEGAFCLLRNRLTDGVGRLYFFSKPKSGNENPHIRLPIRRELQLTTLMETFEIEELEQNLNDITDQMLQISGKSSDLFSVLEQIVKLYCQTAAQMCIASQIGLLTTREYMERMEECDTIKQLKQAMRELFVLPLRTYYQEQARNETNISAQMKRYVSRHYQENIRLIDVANQLYRTPSYIGYIFKRDTGTSFSEYLAAYRINIAKTYLTDTQQTIAGVAEAVGFCDMRHFSKTFQKLVGMTPSAYRKKSGR